MRLRRWLFGAVALVVLLGTLVASRDALWIPIDRPLAPLRGGADPMRLTVMGTSLTARGLWPDRLGDALSACVGRPVTVTRVARVGANSAWGLAAVETVVASRPDLVLIEFAANDADISDGLWLKDSIATHHSILSRLKSALPDTRIALMTMNPAFGMRGWMRPRLAAYYAAYGPLADAHGAGVIDIYDRWQKRADLRAAIPDGLHPGDEAAAAQIVPVVATAVAGRACP